MAASEPLRRIRRWVTGQDGIEDLRVEDIDCGIPGEHEVLVEVWAVSLNYRDTEVCMGVYTHHTSVSYPPVIFPCSDMCGDVVSCGPTSQSSSSLYKNPAFGLKPRDRVLSTLYRYTPNWPNQTLDIAPAPGVLTQHRMSLNGLRSPGKTFASKSKPMEGGEKRTLGATPTINYNSNLTWDQEGLQRTDGRGTDLILEVGGAQTLRKSIECTAIGGLIACMGYLVRKQDGEADRMNVNVLEHRKTATLKGIMNGPRDPFKQMLRFYDEKTKPVMDRVFRFEKRKETIEYIYSDSHFGKVVIKVTE
ncbi:hypothetical protein CC78DRAFT_555522 [Lojkania enalia]|uniref:Enoyl reductase (ER) domain-containing protein n=1 Tax=Lojkania enalia TaxID=147567 RepID=A0A9P4K282_9PLEO|nr:hypothetical protein CC78DRAFT_555522 [Didymosphaeria enalia]